jgi:hypothetical protein
VIGRVKRVLNVALTPFAIGLKDTLRWYTKHGLQKKQDFSFENKLIRLARDHSRPTQII